MALNLSSLIRRSLFQELDDIKGMKTLIMDGYTTNIISLACSQSLIMKKEVFLFQDIRNSAGRNRVHCPKLYHLKAVVVVRNTEENVEALISELSSTPPYQAYFLFFTNKIDSMTIKRLAEADLNEVVKGIKEIYTDFEPILDNVFTLSHPEESAYKFKSSDIKRFSEGLAACIKILRMPSSCILYQSTSMEVDHIASSIRSSIEITQNKDDGVLLILDRRSDPVTPLVLHWSYLSLLHEFLGLCNNKVTIQERDKPEEQFTFSTENDDFYKRNVFSNFGELCSTVKGLIDEFQKRSNEHGDIESLQDIKEFISKYPEFKKMSAAVSKHMTVSTAITSIISERNLMTVSMIEQDIACSTDKGDIMNKLKKHFSSVEGKKIQNVDKLKILLIAVLKTKDASILQPFDIASEEINSKDIQSINNYIARGFELIQKESRQFNVVGSNLIQDFKGVENVYDRYQPTLKEILTGVINGKINNFNLKGFGNYSPSKKIVVFIVGGMTCSEIATVYEVNKNFGARIVIGGTSLLNFETFYREILKISSIYR